MVHSPCHRMIYDHYVNMYNWTFTGRPKEFYDKAKEWFTNQRSWVASQLNSTDSSNDVIWKYMGLINAQYQGEVFILSSTSNCTVDQVCMMATIVKQMMIRSWIGLHLIFSLAMGICSIFYQFLIPINQILTPCQRKNWYPG